MDQCGSKKDKQEVIMEYMSDFAESEKKDREKILTNICKLIKKYEAECLYQPQ